MAATGQADGSVELAGPDGTAAGRNRRGARHGNSVTAVPLPFGAVHDVEAGRVPFAEMPEAFTAEVLPFLSRCVSAWPGI